MAENYNRRNSKVHTAIENLVRSRRGTLAAITSTLTKETWFTRILGLTHEWLRHYSSITQIHGIRWYNLAPNSLFRSFFVLFFITWIITLPVYFTNEGFKLYYSPSLSTAIEWKRDATLTYPNLTVCYAKFFDKKRLEAEGVSNSLANYMTMALDPNVGQLVNYMKAEIPSYGKLLDQLQNELDEKLSSKNITIVDLFHRVAIKCENFVTLCEVHREFLFSKSDNPPEKNCCGALFNITPFFTNAGTCFITNAEVFEKTPFTFSSIKVWLDIQSENAPEFELIFKGSDALERRGIFYTISHQDHPVTKLMQSPYKVPKGTNVLMSLSIKQIDRSGLTQNVFCKSDTEEFEKRFKVEYSKLNCEFFSNSGFQHKCSQSPYYGATLDNGQPPCKPKDFFNSTPNFNDNIYNRVAGGRSTVCLPTCLTTEFTTKVTEAKMDPSALMRYTASAGSIELGKPEDLVILQVYFNSFDYEFHTLYKPTLVDLLSKIGGWLGIINGSSIISVTELFVLFFIFVFKISTGRAD